MRKTASPIALMAVVGMIGLYGNAFAQGANPAPAQQTMSSGASAGQPSDAALNNDVKRALANDPLTRSANIQVTTQDRMVILHGAVTSRRVAKRAEQIASRVNGVKGIENRTEASTQ